MDSSFRDRYGRAAQCCSTAQLTFNRKRQTTKGVTTNMEKKTNRDLRTDKEQHEARTGRPTLKTPELCAKICERVANGETLTSICNEPDMPGWTTVHDWINADESFRQPFDRARE